MAVAGIRRFTVDDFARMGEAGILTEGDRVELIDGEVREMTPIGPPHAWTVDRLTVLVAARLAGTAHLRVQGPIRLGRHTEPQPDLSVSRRAQAYTNRHPDADDLLLVIEVADSSLQYDRGEKVPRYGKAGVPRDVAGERRRPHRDRLHRSRPGGIRPRAGVSLRGAHQGGRGRRTRLCGGGHLRVSRPLRSLAAADRRSTPRAMPFHSLQVHDSAKRQTLGRVPSLPRGVFAAFCSPAPCRDT